MSSSNGVFLSLVRAESATGGDPASVVVVRSTIFLVLSAMTETLSLLCRSNLLGTLFEQSQYVVHIARLSEKWLDEVLRATTWFIHGNPHQSATSRVDHHAVPIRRDHRFRPTSQHFAAKERSCIDRWEDGCLLHRSNVGNATESYSMRETTLSA